MTSARMYKVRCFTWTKNGPGKSHTREFVAFSKDEAIREMKRLFPESTGLFSTKTKHYKYGVISSYPVKVAT